MKTRTYKLVIVNWLIMMFAILTMANSQTANPSYSFPNISCGMDDEIQSSSIVYPYFPMTQDTLRVLVVFCNFPADSSGSFEIPGSSITQFWPSSTAGTKPSWADSIICPTASNVWNRSLTGLFRDASFGQFILLGDVYPELYIFENSPNFYASVAGKMGAAVNELLVNIDSNVNYANYDKFDPEDLNSNGNRREPDGIVDFIFINFRFNNSGTIDGSSYTGYANLSGYSGIFGNGQSEITLDGKRIKAGFPGSGCIYEMNTPWDLGIPAHVFGEHYGYVGGHSEVMGSFNLNGGGLPSAYDREHFGWNLSQSSPSNNISLTLQDFVTTGQYVKIERTNDTIFLENRRRVSYYSSEEYRNWIWLSTDPRNPIMPDSGMLIYRNTHPRGFEVQSAFGKWDWKKCVTSNRYQVSFTSHSNNKFLTDNVNRYNGTSTFFLRDVDPLDEFCQTVLFLGSPQHKVSYSGVNGDINTCFDIGYNQVYSPWSNPPLPVTNANDSLTIELTGRNSDGSLAVNVYFTNILGASPSKPQLLKVEKQSIGDQFSPRLNWNRNLEPDLSGYRIYRGDGYAPVSFAYLGECTDTTYLDESVLLYGSGGGNQPCSYYLVQYTYAVSAYDNSDKESVKSDGAFIEGYSDPCAPIGPMISNPGNSSPNDRKNEILTKSEFRLFDVYPNPFNPSTMIEFDIPEDLKVKIVIFDVSGKQISELSNQAYEMGRHSIRFDGAGLPSGIYYCRLEAGMFVNVKKLVLLK